MISRIEGELESIEQGRATLRCGHLSHEILVTASDSERLAEQVGQTISFHTLEYLEAQGQGTSFVPRLLGFSSSRDREFFELFTTVKGIGNRKALRSLQLPLGRIASAIAAGDTALLTSLPEIGRRTAETIIVDLKDRIDEFILEPGQVDEPVGPAAEIKAESIAVLVQLGESRTDARELVERAMAADPELETAEDVVTAAYRIKQLA